jgi:hypothetical protein
LGDGDETSLPAVSGAGAPSTAGPIMGTPLVQFSALGTPTAYVRIKPLADTFVCANAMASACSA